MFPFELRLELDMLSRQRGLHNDSMETELFKLFQKYGIDAIKLGMGTNRYGFKLNSFAVKFATNEDGRVDNQKEFKMAQCLQPHVIKVYEMSENASLLVTEYIQPFESYREMLQYEGAIKKILAELSSRYLIGDVGISEINFANWGMRIGTTVPVCLDFAYIYNVSSDIFVCPEIKCRNAMLVPTADYSKLQCPICAKFQYYEDIRLRIGKEDHKREIGELSDIAYVLSDSHVLTELDSKRSPYLVPPAQDKKEKKPDKDTDVAGDDEPDEFIIPISERKERRN